MHTLDDASLLSSNLMPLSLESLKRFSTAMALAKMWAAGTVTKPDQLLLADYCKALSPDVLALKHWLAFLGKYDPDQNPFGVSERVVDLNKMLEGDYLLVVVPTDLNGHNLDENELKAGQQFCFLAVDTKTRTTTTGDRFPALLPDEVWQAGQCNVVFVADKDRAAQLIEILQVAYERIVSLVSPAQA